MRWELISLYAGDVIEVLLVLYSKEWCFILINTNTFYVSI